MARAVRVLAAVMLLAAAAACSSSSSHAAAPTTTGATSAPQPSSTTSAASTTTSGAPHSSTLWLCRPGMAANPCEGSLDSTVVSKSGTGSVEHAAAAANPPIDCFYVYPTVSAQKTAVATLSVDPEERAIATTQAARFSQVCRVYAPIYRQATLAAITGAVKGSANASFDVGYRDVVAAWNDYLAHDNHGRGVVLIGHSQGSAVLIQLIKSQIDDNPAVRSRLVSAILLGGNVTVPVGRDVGGDFQHIPVCRLNTQTGCVIAYSSFLDPPPANSLFGRSNAGLGAASAAGQKLQVVCVNPAAPAGGGALLQSYFPTLKFPGPLGAVSGAVPTAPTPWVAYPDRYRAQCTSANGATWLQITPVPGDPRPVVTQTLGPTWGLHLYDVNLAVGDLVTMVRDETAAR
jgi:hypothetical protein